MTSKKYYAVKCGRKPGIYETWEECKNVIDGYSNAEYKSFASKEDAEAYLANKDILEKYKEIAKENSAVIAYVDGSYSDIERKYSFGCILITPIGEVIKKSGCGDDPNAVSARNVAGELQGTMFAVKYASDLGFKKIIIRHDYLGISKWFTGEWKSKDVITKKYVEFMMKLNNHIEISFEKVSAHSGDKYNEEADKLARSALENCSRVQNDDRRNDNQDIIREKLINTILENIMNSSEVMQYLNISAQKLSSLCRLGKLNPIKKGIYLKADIEKLKR